MRYRDLLKEALFPVISHFTEYSEYWTVHLKRNETSFLAVLNQNKCFKYGTYF